MHNAQYKAKSTTLSTSLEKLSSSQLNKGCDIKHIYDSLTRKKAAILSQVRAGNNRLNPYLHRIKAIDSDQCACGQGEETVNHFSLNCSQWTQQRRILLQLAGPVPNDGVKMVERQHTQKGIHRQKPDMEIIKAIIQFVKEMMAPIRGDAAAYEIPGSMTNNLSYHPKFNMYSEQESSTTSFCNL
ncbi:hypothetical protein ACJ73_08285 [Blastomyces percursus]|uniref:Reverse transcriptase zinc-binding domain-containing protein n=1 Tax=Blastomyces percursus TaxID=1658174 RepID=A0A1J9QYJ2_9EURO|nr:hypothetical protein ACJ73_08285 [Blastomyces percursus]